MKNQQSAKEQHASSRATKTDAAAIREEVADEIVGQRCGPSIRRAAVIVYVCLCKRAAEQVESPPDEPWAVGLSWSEVCKQAGASTRPAKTLVSRSLAQMKRRGAVFYVPSLAGGSGMWTLPEAWDTWLINKRDSFFAGTGVETVLKPISPDQETERGGAHD